MKTLTILAFAFLLPFTAHASDPKIKKVKVNCDNVQLKMHSLDNNRFNFGAEWMKIPRFKAALKEPIHHRVGDVFRSTQQNFRYNCPEYSVTYDGNLATIRAKSYDDLMDILDRSQKFVDLWTYTIDEDKSKNIEFQSFDYGFHLETFKLASKYKTLEQGQNLTGNPLAEDIPEDAEILYSVDEQAPKVLLKNRQISTYLDDMQHAKTIDIYHRYPSDPYVVGEAVQKININKEKAEIKIYRKAAYPH